ncbi:ABC transporter permease [Alicyclobacillus sp. SO9]|uniref:ABC transporter permease n=1 Tax=Alicyclobacillus sp. SO9 TaxID=2665646 RepID=UPI0018E7F780|nr:ABC transporter permease [Alicyclobacillus sp. SO9]QQE80169.1 ABC transporter permease [Alicyclobacillus sp. SO9]
MISELERLDIKPLNSLKFWIEGTWNWAMYCFRENLTSPIAFIFDVVYAPAMVVVGSVSFAHDSASARIFLTAGMVFLAVLASAVVSLSGIIVSHKERHLLKRFRATPMSTSAIIVGFFGGSAATALLSAILSYIVAHWMFNVPWPMSMGLTIVSWIGVLVSSALVAVTLSSFLNRVKTSMSLMMPLFFVFIGVSGLFYPMKLSPRWLQIISWFSPTRPASDWFIKSATHSTFVHLYSWEPYVLIAWIIGLSLVSVASFKWD